MRKLVLPMIMLAAFAVGSTLALAGCKQGEGERCQIDADCAEGENLVCNQATQTCAKAGGGDIDATPPIDGAPIDSIDAPPDGPPDAPPDT